MPKRAPAESEFTRIEDDGFAVTLLKFNQNWTASKDSIPSPSPEPSLSNEGWNDV